MSSRDQEDDAALDELEDALGDEEISAGDSSGAEDDEDAEEEEEEEDEEEEEQAPKAKPKAAAAAKATAKAPPKPKPTKKRRGGGGGYADEEDEEDARRLKRSRFIDDIAEVDDDEEEEEAEEGGLDDLIDDRGEVPDAIDFAEVRRAHREADRRVAEEQDVNPEELQRYIAERFGGGRAAAYAAGDGDGLDAAGAVSQQALMPTARDPKLWVVRCAEGAEREAVCCLLQKCYDYAARGQPLLVKSAVAKDQLKGYLYIEAYKESHVREALKGLRSVFHSKAPKLVPLGEMVGAIAVARSAARAPAPGAWVRVRSGLYKGDLARVIDVDPGAGRATIKLVPRLDYSGAAGRRGEDARAPSFGRAPKVRPPARAFQPDEARAARLDVAQQRDRATGEVYWQLGSSQRFQGGYLLKNLAAKSVALEEALPPLDELQRFNAAATGDDAGGGAARAGDLAALVADLAGGEGGGAGLEAAAARGRFVKGDRVVVVEGDLKDIRGRVEHVTEGGQVEVRPTDEALGPAFNDVIAFEPRELAKYFEEGAHVKVLHGTHAGETGLVLRVDGGVCHLLTDATRSEIRAFGRDLSEAVAVASALDSLGDYHLFDLVVLDAQTVGVIVGVDKESCQVLTNQGRPEKPDLRVCRLPDLKRKLDSRRSAALDALRNEVSVNDIVEVFDGPLKGRSGTVKHIMRGFLFVQSRQLQEHGGFFCVQARHCKVRGGKRQPGAPALGLLATPARVPGGGGGAANVLASPARQGGYGGAAGAGGYSGRVAVQQDKLLENKEVTILKGPYRGMRGLIKSATPTHALVELQAQMRRVTVDRAHLPPGAGGLEAQQGGAWPGPGRSMGAGAGAGAYLAPGMPPPVAAPGGRTPAHYSQAQATPAHYSMLGSATPLHPGMTPGREAATATPAYDAAWAATPAHAGSYGGGFGGGQDFHAGQGFAAPPALAPAAPPPPPPAPGGQAQDWVGLEVRLLSGEHAAVRSVDPQGAAAVQLGTETPSGSGAYSFAAGPQRSVRVEDLRLVGPSKGDVVRLLGGEFRGREVRLEVAEGGDAYFKIDQALKLVKMEMCGKLARDA